MDTVRYLSALDIYVQKYFLYPFGEAKADALMMLMNLPINIMNKIY